ncbi:hypothetical protein OF83DRAFT_571364 [Amylostereum chailletii]|nr:hypothetical protein OF83DRAFT_571364 [Amylostereum chailletii]
MRFASRSVYLRDPQVPVPMDWCRLAYISGGTPHVVTHNFVHPTLFSTLFFFVYFLRQPAHARTGPTPGQMAIMHERVTLPPISSLDLPPSSDVARPRSGSGSVVRRGSTESPSFGSIWDARPPATPLPALGTFRFDSRNHPAAFDAPMRVGLPSPQSTTHHDIPSSKLYHPIISSTSAAGRGRSPSHHRRRDSGAPSSIAFDSASVSSRGRTPDSWSQYDSEHPDSPDAHMRSTSPRSRKSSTGRIHAGSAEPVEMRFINTTPADAQVAGTTFSSSRGKIVPPPPPPGPPPAAGPSFSPPAKLSQSSHKRKLVDTSDDELIDDDLDAPGEGKDPRRVQADGRRKYKKMMNVRHYRAQTKDALKTLRDILPEHMRPLERQARSFTVVNGASLLRLLRLPSPGTL